MSPRDLVYIGPGGDDISRSGPTGGFGKRVVRASSDDCWKGDTPSFPFRHTRTGLIAALKAIDTKRDRNPPTKHGNIPL